ncbi:MAG TPA: hypothetical protein VFG04_08840 [Planctomycetaceae bacterium]|jgi:hypothetical protein|nr:hypothetical protein [Planctomycetaceae bacterium]
MHHRLASLGRTWVLCSCVVVCVAAQRPRVPAADLAERLAEPPAKENKAAEVRPTSTEARYKLELVRSTDKRVAAGGGGGTVYQVAVTPDGKRVLIGGDSRIPVAMLWNLETGAMERFFNVFDMETDGSPISVAIGPDGNKAALFTSRNRIFLVEFARRNLLHRLDRYGFTFGITYAPDGKWIALFEASGDVTFID